MIDAEEYLIDYYGYIDNELLLQVADGKSVIREPVYTLHGGYGGSKVIGYRLTIHNLKKAHKKMFRLFGL